MSERSAGRESTAFVCSHVFGGSSPVLLVAREDGDWMFLCGAGHSEEEQYHVVGIEHLTARDPSLFELLDLADDSEAEREAVGMPWSRARIDEDEH